MIEQGTEEWFAQRLGKVTASRVSDVMAKTKSGAGAGRKNYMMELLCQRLTGQREEGFTSAAMLRGIELEPVARSAYEIATGDIVTEAGFVIHPEQPQTGASPDGYVGLGGLIEIKCPNTAQHIAVLQSGCADPKYVSQMQHQMACTKALYCDFVSFDDRLPEALQIVIVRVERDEAFIARMMSDINLFLQELDKLESDMLKRMGL